MENPHLWRRALPLLTLVAALGLTARARAEVVSLATLEAQALKNRPVLAREAARARAADADVKKAASAYYPQFALKADFNVAPGRQLLRFHGEDGQGEYMVTGAASLDSKKGPGDAFKGYPRSGIELTASANLYDFGRTQSATAAGREARAAAAQNRALTEAELLSTVRESYLGWLLSSELARLSVDALTDAGQRRERVEALIQEGAKPKGELTPARAEELLARLELERAQRDLAAAVLDVEHAVGAPLAQDSTPERSLLEIDGVVPDRRELWARHHRALHQRYRAARALANAQSTLNRPQLGLGLSAGVRTSSQKLTEIDPVSGEFKENENLDTSTFPLYAAGLTLNVPLWDGGFTRAGVDAARARAEEAKADLAEFEQERSFAQRRAELDADSAITRLATADELITVCVARLKDAEAGYELGVSSIDQIAQARSLLRRAQTEALLARVDSAAARLRMEARETPTKAR